MARPSRTKPPGGERLPWDDDLPRAQVNPQQTIAVDYRHMHICRRCLRLEGWCWDTREWRFQAYPRCPARKHTEESRWQGYDYNEVVCLCSCCGATLLRSGSKFSVWFCGDCKDRAVHVNRFLQAYVLPVGRHSVMSLSCQQPPGVMSETDIRNPKKVRAFVEGLGQAFNRMQRLADWEQKTVEYNLECLGFQRSSNIALPLYLRALQAAPIDTKLRFVQMCEFMGLPRMGLDALGYRPIDDGKVT